MYTRTTLLQYTLQLNNIFHAVFAKTTYRVGILNVKPYTKTSCNSWMMNVGRAATTLLTRVDRKRRDGWFDTVQNIGFLHFSRKKQSIFNTYWQVKTLCPSLLHSSYHYRSAATQNRKVRRC